MHPFSYVRAHTLEEALAFLDCTEDSHPLAGGTDLILHIRHRRFFPKVLVSISRVSSLRYLAVENGAVQIGALTTLRELRKANLPGVGQMLREVAGKMGCPEVRNVATVGGNLCNADPAADLVPPLMAMGASVVLRGNSGQRIIPLDDFVLGPRITALRRGELLTEIKASLPQEPVGWGYAAYSTREGMGISLVSAACLLKVGPDNTCEEVKLVLGAITDKPMVVEAARVLVGQKGDSEVFRDISEAALSGLEIRLNPAVPEWYLRWRARLVIEEALTQAWQRGQAQ